MCASLSGGLIVGGATYDFIWWGRAAVYASRRNMASTLTRRPFVSVRVDPPGRYETGRLSGSFISSSLKWFVTLLFFSRRGHDTHAFSSFALVDYDKAQEWKSKCGGSQIPNGRRRICLWETIARLCHPMWFRRVIEIPLFSPTDLLLLSHLPKTIKCLFSVFFLFFFHCHSCHLSHLGSRPECIGNTSA